MTKEEILTMNQIDKSCENCISYIVCKFQLRDDGTESYDIIKELELCKEWQANYPTLEAQNEDLKKALRLDFNKNYYNEFKVAMDIIKNMLNKKTPGFFKFALVMKYYKLKKLLKDNKEG